MVLLGNRSTNECEITKFFSIEEETHSGSNCTTSTTNPLCKLASDRYHRHTAHSFGRSNQNWTNADYVHATLHFLFNYHKYLFNHIYRRSSKLKWDNKFSKPFFLETLCRVLLKLPALFCLFSKQYSLILTVTFQNDDWSKVVLWKELTRCACFKKQVGNEWCPSKIYGDRFLWWNSRNRQRWPPRPQVNIIFTILPFVNLHFDTQNCLNFNQ